MTINELKRNIKLYGSHAIKIDSDSTIQKQQCQELLINSGFKWWGGNFNLNVENIPINYFVVDIHRKGSSQQGKFYIKYNRNLNENKTILDYKVLHFFELQNHIKIDGFVNKLFNEII